MQLMKEILRQMKECDQDEEIKAIILTGTDGVFSVGADMKELSTVKTYGEVRFENWDHIPVWRMSRLPLQGGGVSQCFITIRKSRFQAM